MSSVRYDDGIEDFDRDDLTELRLTLACNGYSPIPVRGKIPDIGGWQKARNVPHATIAAWTAQFPQHINTGILTADTPAADIDISTDEAAAVAVEELLARSRLEFVDGRQMVRVGQAPKRAMLFRSDIPFKNLRLDFDSPLTPDGKRQGIEILADGQQIVVAGIHPDTLQPYRWHGGDLVSVSRAELPAITRDDMLEFLTAAQKLLVEQHGFTGPKMSTDPGSKSGDGQRDERSNEPKAPIKRVAAALRAIPNNDAHWDDWNRIAMATFAATGGSSAGLAAFSVWSQKSGKHNELQTQGKWAALHRTPPHSVGAGTLFLLAAQADPNWEDGAYFAAPQQQPRIYDLRFIDMSKWDNEPTPERQWAVEERIPMRQVFLHTGDGGTGKSLAELMRSCAHVLGRDWLGMKVKQGPVIYLSAEDDRDELHIRLKAIARHYETTVSALIAGGLHLLDYAGEYCILGAPDKGGIIRPTELFRKIEAAALRIKPVAVTIDTVADTYAGSEIDRQQTTQYVKLGQRLAQTVDCSVALVAHPSVAGIQTGTGLSGSTAWHNKVRARAYMKRVPAEEGGDDDLREIKFMKNNYGRQGDSIMVRWQAGVFVLEDAADNDLKRRAQDREVDVRFLELLAMYEREDRVLSENPYAAKNFAPKVFATVVDGKKFSATLYEAAMERLLRLNEIHVSVSGRKSKPTRRLMREPKPAVA